MVEGAPKKGESVVTPPQKREGGRETFSAANVVFRGRRIPQDLISPETIFARGSGDSEKIFALHLALATTRAALSVVTEERDSLRQQVDDLTGVTAAREGEVVIMAEKERIDQIRLTIPYASPRVRKAGDLLRQARGRHGVTIPMLARRNDASKAYLESYEQGQIARPDSDKIMSAVEMYLDEEDEQIVQMQELLHAEAYDQQWLTTFTYAKNMTIGRAAEFLRVGNMVKLTEFAKKAGVDPSALGLVEADGAIPTISILDSLIGASSVSINDKSAQKLRLLRANKDPMTLSDVAVCHFGNLFLYLCQTQGLATRDLVKPLHRTQSAISYIQSGQFMPKADVLERVITFFELSPNEGLGAALVQKSKKPLIKLTEQQMKKILSGQYLFAEHVPAFPEVSQATKEILEKFRQVRGKSVSGEPGMVNRMLVTLMEHKGVNAPALYHRAGIGSSTWEGIASKGNHPKKETVAKISTALAHGIDDPVFWELMDAA